MTIFDWAVLTLASATAIMGFRSGFLRGLILIVGYAAALPIAAALATRFGVEFDRASAAPGEQNVGLFFAIFLGTGLCFTALVKYSLGDVLGSRVGLADRLAGALLGLARTGLVAVSAALVLDATIPRDREPAFLHGSRLRPLLSAAGQEGLKLVPPSLATYLSSAAAQRRV